MIFARTKMATAAAALLVLAACAAPAGAPDASASDREPSGSPLETVQASASADPAPDAPHGIPQAAWDAILDDLSGRVDDPVSTATVVTAEAMTWNDGSLGCPQPGQVYTQALVEGYQVILAVDGREFDYRVGAGSDVRLCRT
jgi:hypothetical protein